MEVENKKNLLKPYLRVGKYSKNAQAEGLCLSDLCSLSTLIDYKKTRDKKPTPQTTKRLSNSSPELGLT